MGKCGVRREFGHQCPGCCRGRKYKDGGGVYFSKRRAAPVMFVIVPLCDVPSPEKTERLISLLSKIAPFTYESEPKCHAYAWFRNAGDNDVPHHWIRGLEVYETPEDNRETHRAGEAYQNFRAAVAAEGLLNGYPDVRFWRPTGIGYLTKSPLNFMAERHNSKEYVVIQDLTPRAGAKAKVLEALSTVAKFADKIAEVGSFWVLDRDNEEDGEDVVVFTRFDSKEASEGFMATKEAAAWKDVDALCESVKTTTWTESGIGYLSR